MNKEAQKTRFSLREKLQSLYLKAQGSTSGKVLLNFLRVLLGWI